MAYKYGVRRGSDITTGTLGAAVILNQAQVTDHHGALETEMALENIDPAGNDVDLGLNKITNLADPVSSGDAVTKSYADALGGGGGGGDALDLDIGTSSTTFPAFAAADGDTTGSVMHYLNVATTKGDIFYLDGASWTLAQANAPGTSEGLLMLATGTNSDSDGMMVQGYVRLDSGSYGGTPAIGDVAYLSDTASGLVTFTQPATSGDTVRAVGYCVQKDGSDHILLYFNPSPEYSELA